LGIFTTRRSIRSVLASIPVSVLVGVLTALALAACNGTDPVPPTAPAATPAQKATTQAAAIQQESASETATAESTETSAAPEQVTETDDGTESVTEAPPATTTGSGLKLAAASSEPKLTASAFKEGVHYRRLVPTQPISAPSGQVEVAEIFWYGCPHCFALDSKLENWRKSKPDYAMFVRIPGAINEAALFHGRIFYAAELLGKLDELHPAIFREIHLNGNALNTMDKAKAFFTANGVTPAAFDKAFASFKLESKVQNANLLLRRYRVTGVPYFVVNGKFTTDVESAGGEEPLLQLLNELAAREHVN
jgi:protein dithiol oxidoreductase (disulfide-forming)